MQAIPHAVGAATRSPVPLGSLPAPPRPPRIGTPFARDVIAGLSRPQKSIPCTWLYDRRGSELFEEITHLDEYYPTRTEVQILQHCARQIAIEVGPGATLVELGSGSSRKTPILLGALDAPSAYVPVDIAADYLADSIRTLQAAFPNLPMHPIVGDMALTETLAPLRRSIGALARAAKSARPWSRRLGFFPGSTIGNFAPDNAVALLGRIGLALGEGSLLVVGVDSTRDRSVLIPAYDDREGVTGTFNKNLLTRINRELEGDFDPQAFNHEARFNEQRQCVEMHLVSKTWETFEVLGRRFCFAAGESIHTESSYKYSLNRFQALAQHAGWEPVQFWTDSHARFGVHLLRRHS
jgi:L-histidine Nalpha-methyltransferase